MNHNRKINSGRLSAGQSPVTRSSTAPSTRFSFGNFCIRIIKFCRNALFYPRWRLKNGSARLSAGQSPVTRSSTAPSTRFSFVGSSVRIIKFCRNALFYPRWRLKNGSARLSAGQSLIEIIVALGILTLSLAASFQLFFGGQRLTSDSANAGLAFDLGNQGIEAVRSIRDRNWAELSPGNHGLVFNGSEWLFGSTSTSDGQDIFTRTVIIENLNENAKIATTTVTWLDGGSSKVLEFVEILTNWQEPTQSSCKAEALAGNWAMPVSLGTGDLGSGNEGTDLAVRLPYVYMSGTASSASKPDIFVFDVSNLNQPQLVKSLDIGSNGINQIYLKDNYLYAASSNDSKELIIFDVSDPVNISQAATYNLSGNTNAISVIAFGNTVAIGRDDPATYELTFLDVSNLGSISVISQVTTGGDLNDFAISNSRLFAVSEESDEDVWIYDITDPGSPAFVATYDITGTTDDLSIYFHEKNGTTLLVGNEENELVSIGATNTAQMYVRDRVTFGGDINDIVCVADDLAFLATSDSIKEFLIVNLADPDNLSEYASLNYPQLGTGIEFASNTVFMSVRSNDSLRIITSTPQ